jgi:hypothetical protein
VFDLVVISLKGVQTLFVLDDVSVKIPMELTSRLVSAHMTAE